MNQIKTDKKQNIPCIQKTIDGCTYTVLIHFKEDTKNTVKDKIKRLLKSEVEQGVRE